MADAGREQEAVERRTATRVDGGDQIGGRYLRPAFAVEKLVLCQLEDVGGRLEETVPKEALDMDDAQTFDVERVARHEMPQPFDPLRRADKAAGAAYVDLALLAHRVGVTFGAFRRAHIGRPTPAPRHLLQPLRDDVEIGTAPL